MAATPAAARTTRRSAKLRNGIILGSLLLLAGTVVAWQLKPAQPKPLNSDTITLAKYFASSDFQDLDEVQKRPYREVIRSKNKELAQALANGKITRAEYDEAYLNGWLARTVRTSPTLKPRGKIRSSPEV